jgi:glycosyltransferase involved in cell wall biosynthesis
MQRFEDIEKSKKLTILVLSWRDIRAPKMGGAEIFTHEMISRCKTIRFIHFSPMFPDAASREDIDEILYLRSGGILSVIAEARRFYRQNRHKIDYVIDECNTHRFFTKFWVEKNKRIFMIFQLTREIWKYMVKFPANLIGSLFETTMLKLNKNDYTITISKSTKQDLLNVGYADNKVSIIYPGLNFVPFPLEMQTKKESAPTFIYVGRFAKYKGIDIAINAFCMLKKECRNAKLWITGKKDTDYITEVLEPICRQQGISLGEPEQNADITLWGFVSEQEKLRLMSRAKALVFPSIREGWGMIVTEAGAVGTPSIVFDSPGARDAVNYGQAGYICEVNDAVHIYRLMKNSIENEAEYQAIRKKGYEFACQFSWEKTAQEFEKYITRRTNTTY